MFIVDRIKELIKVKGLQVEKLLIKHQKKLFNIQVAPAELEDAIRGLDGVDDVAVIGECQFSKVPLFRLSPNVSHSLSKSVLTFQGCHTPELAKFPGPMLSGVTRL